MELSYKQIEDLIDDVLRRYKDYVFESYDMDYDQKIAVLETIMSDLVSNVNSK